MNNYYNLLFSTTPHKQFSPTIPHTYFSSKFRSILNFIEVLTDDKPDTCATIIQNSTNHIATLPIGHIGYIEIPMTIEKPKYYQVNDINTLIHNVTDTYHPELTEPIPPTNYSIPPEQKSASSTPFSLHQVCMTNLNPFPLFIMYNLLLILPNPKYSLPYHIHQKISNLSTNSTSNYLTLQLLNMVHFVICYSNIRPAMLPIKMTLARLQLLFVSDSNRMLN